MTKFLDEFFDTMKPAFAYHPTFVWFVIVFAGLVMRTDTFGVTSIVRALFLPASAYPNLVHFFHSTAWSANSLLNCWRQWVLSHHVAFTENGRIVLIGDHTKSPKDGRNIPNVTTLHQESETASKPSFFRGHEWGCVALLTAVKSKFFATPLNAEIHNDSSENDNRITRMVDMAGKIMESSQQEAYLVLDAYFAAGSTFDQARQWGDKLHILTRAKKNVTAFVPVETPKVKKRGRPRLYGEKLKLMDLFDEWSSLFLTDDIRVYQKVETIRYQLFDLMWKPTKSMIRFLLFETSRGRIILMTSDLHMTHTTALKLYCHRVTIEIMFDVLKNILGGLKYHFWSKYLIPASRRPKRGKQATQQSLDPMKTHETQRAIEKFVSIQLVLLGFLQILALKFPDHVCKTALCWLRTSGSEIPSEFVTKIAVSNLIRGFLNGSSKNRIALFIRNKRKSLENTGLSGKVA